MISCLKVIQYYANKVISLHADRAQAEVAKQIDVALKDKQPNSCSNKLLHVL